MSGQDTISQGILKERFEWDNKYFRIYTNFRPNLKANHLTPKFYAHHEGSESLDDVDPNILKLILDHHTKGPREKCDYPPTENQRYGWYQELLIPMNKNDRRLNNHRSTTKDIKLIAEIKKHLVKEPTFGGIPFKL